MNIFTNSFSEETWFQKYKVPKDKTIQDTWTRVAKAIASIEKDKEKWEKDFYSIMENFQFVPGGRITSNAGAGFKGVSLINCFCDGFEGKDLDSIENIYATLTKQAHILKSEGGYGFCANVMRPRGSTIHGIGNQSPGAVKFLELWDKSSEIITAGSGFKSKDGEKNFIRKGAQMVTMSDWHPDIIEFIEAKKTPGRLSKFNMSVLCSDEFMNAVMMDAPWSLVFPNYEQFPKEYKEKWNGNIEEWINYIFMIDPESTSEAVVVYHTFESARELWDLIMTNSYNRNEPGVLFIDNMNKMNNLYYCEYIMQTNPCGEQILPIGGVCLLGSINLVHFIKNNTWDYEKLGKTIDVAIRFMDNVNDITYVPLDSQKKNLKDKRRIGLGIMGYGSALLMMKIKYGSKKVLELTEQLMEFFTNRAYQASCYLAKEKGAFPLYDKELYLKSKFVQKLSNETKDLIKKYGMRNSHVTSIQPTGNSSCVANLVSGGLEPSFMSGYYRTSIQPFAPDGLPVPTNIDWSNQTYDLSHNGTNINWKWKKEGDEYLLVTTFNGKTWKYDRTRGLLKEEWLEDFGVSFLKIHEQWDEKAPWAAFAMDLSIDDHVNTMTIFAKWVDSAISKTVNIKNDYPYDDFKDVYKKAWKNGIKGFTTYREGTMATVLSTKSTKDGIQKTKSPERPKELPCDVHHIKVKGESYFVLVGLYEKDAYEVFAGKNGFIGKNISKGTIIKLERPKGVYKAILEDGMELSPINATCTEEEDALTRMTSTALRHGADVHMIVQQLEKVKGDMHCFAKSMSRALKKYIPDGSVEEEDCPECGATNSLIRQEGCLVCKQCSHSKCS